MVLRYLAGLLLTTTSILAATVAAMASESDEPSYAVVVSRSTHDNPQWKPVVDALVRKHRAEVIVLDDRDDKPIAEHLADGLPELRRIFPRHACFVARPEEAGRGFVVAVHEVTRRLDDDPYTDTRWGILTGYDAVGALRIARHEKPLVIEKVAAGTRVALECCREGVWYCELKQNRMVRKQPGGEPTEQRAPDDTTAALVDTLNQYRPGLFITSGHATERGWQIGYGYRNGTLQCKDGRLIGVDTAGKTYSVDSPNPKVYMPVGNCLMGHVDSRDAMALAWMNSAGVMQMLGYIVPTWYGYAGWGCLDYFIEQPGRYTFSEAFFANQHALIHRLERTEPGTHDHKGLMFDSRAVAFYGDPAWEARMAPGPLKFEQSLRRDGNRYTFTVRPTAGPESFGPVDGNGSQRGGRPLVGWLDHRIGEAKLIEGGALNPVIADDFILVPRPETCDPGRAYRVVFEANPAE
jgi:zinc protease